MLWDDIAASEVTLPDSVREEMERRAAEMDADPSVSITEEELWRRVDEALG
jgi:putative addiction module component (TIGR02574 family)